MLESAAEEIVMLRKENIDLKQKVLYLHTIAGNCAENCKVKKKMTDEKFILTSYLKNHLADILNLSDKETESYS